MTTLPTDPTPTVFDTPTENGRGMATAITFSLKAIAPHQALDFVGSMISAGFTFVALDFWGESDGDEFDGVPVEAIEGDRLYIDGRWIDSSRGDYGLTLQPPAWVALD